MVWTFRSGQVDGTAALPLWTVRFSPVLDDRNAAAGGREFPVPVTVAPNPGAQVGKVRELTVEASYDDGATWDRVPLRDGAALVRHPAGGGFVSLRATATDSVGNTVRQTVVRAYRYGPV